MDDLELFAAFVNQLPLPEEDGRWVCAVVVCEWCGHEMVSVHPIECEELECSCCGYMTLAPEVDGA